MAIRLVFELRDGTTVTWETGFCEHKYSLLGGGEKLDVMQEVTIEGTLG